MSIDLEQILEAMEQVSDTANAYLDTRTGATILLDAKGQDPEAFISTSELIHTAPRGRFLLMPTKFSIHEYSIIKKFVYSLPAGHIQDDLADAIQGTSPFERFAQQVALHGMEQDWHDFRACEFAKCAREWCDDNGLDCIENVSVSDD